jgi:hypothetical protein
MSEQTEAQVKGEHGVIEITREDGERMINSPANDVEMKFAEDYLKSPEKYRLVESKATSDSPQGNTPQGGSAESSPTSTGSEEVEISGLKIPVSLLGTYAKNRTPQEALVEALKGISEKDATIAALREADTSAVPLRDRVREIKSRRQASAPSVIPDEVKLDLEELNLDHLPVDESIFDTENAGKMVKAIKGLSEQNKMLAEALRKNNDSVRSAAAKNAELSSVEDVEQLRAVVLDDNISQVERLQKVDPTLKTKKSFRDLDAEIGKFWETVSQVSGLPQREAAAAYSDATSDAGKKLRETLAQKNVSAPDPEDMGKHAVLMQVHFKRQEKIERLQKAIESRSGKKPEVWEIADDVADLIPSYAKVYEDFVGGNRIMQAKIAGARDVMTPKNTDGVAPIAREVPAEMGGAPKMTLDTVDPSKLSALMARDSRTYSREEAALVAEYFNKNGMSSMIPAAVKKLLQT